MGDSQKSAPQDPRHAMAQRYLQAAHDELATKEQESPRKRTHNPRSARTPQVSDLKPSFSGSFFVHAMMLMVVLVICGLAFVLFYHLMMRQITFPAGRAIAIPVGFLWAMGLSYMSACFLGIVESTSHGHTDPEDALRSGWIEWFWTIPTSFGMLFVSVMVGYAIGVVTPLSIPTAVGVACWLLYPVLQLSTMEAGSFVSLFSWPILKTLATRPLVWMLFFALSFGLISIVAAFAKLMWVDPPYRTAAAVGPVAAIAFVVYAWLLGQLARWLSIGGT